MFGGAVQAPLEGVHECYEARLIDDPSAAGDLALSLWVSNRQVIRTTVVEPLGDETLQECAVARIRELRLPAVAPAGGARVAFTLSFAAGSAMPARPEEVLASVEE